MPNRGIAMLLLALVAGLSAVVLAARWIQQRTVGSPSQIAVAQVDIRIGGRISSSMLSLVDWPVGSVPDGAFHDLKALEGRVTRSGLQRGEPVLESRLAAEGTRGGLSAVVDPGKRAMTVRVNDVIGVAGFALPGSYVDVMVNLQSDSGRMHSVSKIVLERILVLAMDQDPDRDTTKPNVSNAVTLEVTPDQAEKLDLARSVGTLSLVLRNETDPAAVATSGATPNSLLGLPTAPAPTPPAPPPVRKVPVATLASNKDSCVVLIRGTTKVTECF